MMKFIFLLLLLFYSPYSYSSNKFNFKLNGYLDTNVLLYPNTKNYIFSDFFFRTQLEYKNKYGIFYSIDESSIYDNRFSKDIFVFYNYKDFGRIEFGLTDPVSYKLSLDLPDVSGLSINDNFILYRTFSKNAFSNNFSNGYRYSPRINLVSTNIGSYQYGVSLSSLSEKYDYSFDIGLKYKDYESKTKISFSSAMSFIDSPNRLNTDIFLPPVYADWRLQFSTGFNIQYNSFILNTNFRGVYDYQSLSNSDGINLAFGISYDILNYTFSISNISSLVGIFKPFEDYFINTDIFSFKYKYNKNVHFWTSFGISNSIGFIYTGIKFII